MEKETIETLFDIYAKYFIEDFARRVHSNISASHPIETRYLNEFITYKTGAFFSDNTMLNKPNTNDITRFIMECVEFVIDHDVSDPESLSTWDYVSNLPSIHHDAIAADIFASATLYLQTVNQTLIDVVMRDATNTVQTIANKSQLIHDVAKSGGKLHIFNWGLLNDGLWLNGAMLSAFDRTKVFRPGEPIAAYHAKVCMDAASTMIAYESISPEIEAGLVDTFNLLISNSPKHITDEHDRLDGKFDFTSALKYASSLLSWIDYWELGFKDPKVLVDSVDILSSALGILIGVRDTAHGYDEDSGIVHADILGRIHHLIDILTMCLVSFEAVRETIFNDTLILYAVHDDADHTTQSYINEDVLNTYYGLGGSDSDLLKLSTYIAGKPNIKEAEGWKLAWATTRRDDIVSQVMSEEAERQEEVSIKSTNTVKNVIIGCLSDITLSYLEPKNFTAIPPKLEKNIYDIATAAVRGDESFSLESAIFHFLVSATLDNFVYSMANRLTGYITSDSEDVRNRAFTLAIVESAIEDAVAHVFDIHNTTTSQAA